MEWLSAPFRFFHPQPGVPFRLSVIRYEVGLAMREIDDPPFTIVRPTIRFHLADASSGVPRPYVDFTNRVLMQAILAIYDRAIDELTVEGIGADLQRAAALSPQRSEPLTVQLTRAGTGINTVYDVREAP